MMKPVARASFNNAALGRFLRLCKPGPRTRTRSLVSFPFRRFLVPGLSVSDAHGPDSLQPWLQVADLYARVKFRLQAHCIGRYRRVEVSSSDIVLVISAQAQTGTPCKARPGGRRHAPRSNQASGKRFNASHLRHATDARRDLLALLLLSPRPCRRPPTL